METNAIVSPKELGALGEAVPIVLVQFSFSNEGPIPKNIRRADNEGVLRCEERAERCNGKIFIDPIEQIECAELVGDLHRSGYQLGDASWQMRIGGQRGRYYAVRFEFRRDGSVQMGAVFDRELAIDDCEDPMHSDYKHFLSAEITSSSLRAVSASPDALTIVLSALKIFCKPM